MCLFAYENCAESQHVCFWHKTFNEIDAFVPTKRENDIVGVRECMCGCRRDKKKNWN